MADLFGFPRKRRRKASRRAGKIPHVGNVPRSRTQSGKWRKKRKDTGKKKTRRNILGI